MIRISGIDPLTKLRRNEKTVHSDEESDALISSQSGFDIESRKTKPSPRIKLLISSFKEPKKPHLSEFIPPKSQNAGKRRHCPPPE
jgi:hypothetical protein